MGKVNYIETIYDMCNGPILYYFIILGFKNGYHRVVEFFRTLLRLPFL